MITRRIVDLLIGIIGSLRKRRRLRLRLPLPRLLRLELGPNSRVLSFNLKTRARLNMIAA